MHIRTDQINHFGRCISGLKAKVYLEWDRGYFFKETVDVLGEVADLVFEPLTDEEFKKEISEASAAIIRLKRIDEKILDLAPKLKVIARHGVGYDNVDVDACTRRGIYVTITSDVLSVAVAELTFALMLSLIRKICMADRYVRTKWARREAPLSLGVELKDKSMGIIGVGRIGYEVAKRAHAFGMKILYHDIVRRREIEEESSGELADLRGLMSKSDFISIHVPLNKKTRGMIGEQELSLMKETAFLINTSRGQVVDQQALTVSLKEKRIAGTGLDVFAVEPVPLNDDLLKLDNVILTPHIGSSTIETRKAMVLRASENVLHALKGSVPPDLIPEQARIFRSHS